MYQDMDKSLTNFMVCYRISILCHLTIDITPQKAAYWLLYPQKRSCCTTLKF